MVSKERPISFDGINQDYLPEKNLWPQWALIDTWLDYVLFPSAYIYVLYSSEQYTLWLTLKILYIHSYSKPDQVIYSGTVVENKKVEELHEEEIGPEVIQTITVGNHTWLR